MAQLPRPEAAFLQQEPPNCWQAASILPDLCQPPLPSWSRTTSHWDRALFQFFVFHLFSLLILSPLPLALPWELEHTGVGMVLAAQGCLAAASTASPKLCGAWHGPDPQVECGGLPASLPIPLPGLIPSTCQGGWWASGVLGGGWDRAGNKRDRETRSLELWVLPRCCPCSPRGHKYCV